MVMSAVGDLTIRELRDGRGVKDWLAVQPLVFRDDPAWIRPLDLVERRRIDRRHNPFFNFGEAALFVAYRGGVPVGRISAQVNQRHLDQHGDAAGHFGFFDCIDDQEVARGLLDRAGSWLRERGLKRVIGPTSFSINEDIGLLVDGFDTEPAIMCSHAPPYAGRLLEQCGFSKEIDLLAYRIDPRMAIKKSERLGTLFGAASQVKVRQIKVRHLNLADFRAESQIIFDIYNDGWRDNWGFVPFDKTEIEVLGREMRPLMRSKFGRIIEIDGKPAATVVCLPDINRVIAPFRGRLLPFNWARLLAAIRRDRWTTARIAVMGIRMEYRKTPLAMTLLSQMITAMLKLEREYAFEWMEFSWILENNHPMVKVAEYLAGPPRRVYRVYTADL